VPKNKITGGIVGNYWRGRSGPCVGMGSGNVLRSRTGRAVRWGNPQVSRRGLTKGVFDSKYGQRAASFGPFRL